MAPEFSDVVAEVADLLRVDATGLSSALTTKMIRSARRTSFTQVNLRKPQARDGRDALSKDVYNALFLWTVRRINDQLLVEVSWVVKIAIAPRPAVLWVWPPRAEEVKRGI